MHWKSVRIPDPLITILPTAFLLVVYAGTLVNYYLPIIGNGNQFDDSYITYRYAVNLATGKGLVFNAGERINSASSPAYAILLSALYRLGFHNLERVGAYIGIASGSLVILYTTALATRLSGGHIWATVLVLLPLAVSGSLTGWAVSGMETILYAALVVMFLHYYTVRKITASLILLSLCLLTRPEAVLLLMALVPAEIMNLLCRRPGSMLAPMLAVGAVTLIGYYAFSYLYYGSVIPQPVMQKGFDLFYEQSFVGGAKAMISFFDREFAIIWTLGLLFSALVIFQASRLLLAPYGKVLFERAEARSGMGKQELMFGEYDHVNLVVAAFIVGSVLSFVWGPSSIGERYETPLLPELAIAAICLIAYTSRKVAFSSQGARRLATLCAAVAILTIGCDQAFTNQRRLSGWWMEVSEHAAARKRLGLWIEQNVPADEPIISSDIGGIAYAAMNHRFIDVLGLTSAEPLLAVEHGNWRLFTEGLRIIRPVWAADTVSDDGNLGAFRIIRNPSAFFRGLGASSSDFLNLESAGNQVAAEQRTPRGALFRVIKIDPIVYDTSD